MNKKEQKFLQIYELSKDKIYRICLGFMGNKVDADDLFQEVIIKVWSNIDRFRGESNVNTWIYRITTNTALLSINKINKSKSRYTVLIPEKVQTENTEELSFYTQENLKDLYQAISSLKEIDRIIISLLFEELSYKEIAQITGISLSNVGARLNRIKKTLAKKIK